MSDKSDKPPRFVRRGAVKKGPNSRRSLSNVGGPVRVRGDASVGDLLREAMQAAAGPPENLAYTHGFHSYPARLHPAIPQILLRELKPKRVLDPFMGGGTVLVEALVTGTEAVGTDLNPLAVRVARTRTQVRKPEEIARLIAHLKDTAIRSEDRVRTRVPVKAKLPAREVSWYEMHTLKELAGLLEEIRLVPEKHDRQVLEMVFSAIAVKFAQQQGDTSRLERKKRIRKGLPTEFFLRKGLELARGLRELARAVPPKTKRAVVRESDVRSMASVMPKGFLADAIITSPPYGGTYDYLDHHRRRFAWLDISPGRLSKGEIGSRRNLKAHGSRQTWDQEVSEMLKSMRAVCEPDARIVLVVGDAEIAGKPLAADEHLQNLAESHGFRFRAVASQTRPDFRGKADRHEHLLALEAITR